MNVDDLLLERVRLLIGQNPLVRTPEFDREPDCRHSYEICPLCGNLRWYYSSPHEEPGVAITGWGLCYDCQRMGQEHRAVFEWVNRVVSFQRILLGPQPLPNPEREQT